MQLTSTSTSDTVQVSMSVDEADAVCDDLGDIRASEISAAGDELHGLLETMLGATGGA